MLKPLRRLLCVLIIIALFIPIVTVYSDSPERVINVGYTDEFCMSYSAKDRDYYGFTYEYLKEIAKHTGWTYNFVAAKSPELISMLEKGEIDILGPLRKSEFTTPNSILYSDLSVATIYSGIYVNEGSSNCYGDFTFSKGDKVGVLKEYYDIAYREYLYRMPSDYIEVVKYDTIEQLNNDLRNCVIAASIKQNTIARSDEKLVYNISMGEGFFAVSAKSEGVIDELNAALSGIILNQPEYNRTMAQKYFARTPIAFTAEEQVWITAHPVIRVAFNGGWSPIEYYDERTNTLVGMTADILAIISARTGLQFDVINAKTIEDSLKLLDNDSADIACSGLNSSSIKDYNGYTLTSPYISSPVVMVTKNGSYIEKPSAIAILNTANDILNYVKNTYASSALTTYDTIEKCFNAVRDGKAQAVFAPNFDAQMLLSESSYSTLGISTATITDYKVCFTLNKNEAAELTSILNKVILRVTDNDIAVSAFSNIAKLDYTTIRISRFMAEHAFETIIIIVVLCLIVCMFSLHSFAKLKKEAYVDRITGGRNRLKFEVDATEMLKKKPRTEYVVAQFDIDRFKFINDRFGYQKGDRILARIYKTMAEILNNRDEVFARLDSDRFAILLHTTDEKEIYERLKGMYERFTARNAPHMQFGKVVFCCGIYKIIESDSDIKLMLDKANIALKSVKSRHKTCISYYDETLREMLIKEKDLETIMPLALEHHEFVVYLQPKYSLKTLKIEGAEALIRWNSRDHGLIFPGDFIPTSEKNGFVVELDFFVLEEVCKRMKKWLVMGRTPVVVSVNQSRQHINSPDYIERLKSVVDKYGIPYEYIELELTETVFFEDAERLLSIMSQLHNIGFRLSLDDFGSGYSSLNLLKDIPVDVVKIDREFFNETVTTQRGRTVITTVVDLAKSLDMEVISEGVETKEQVDFLSDIKCNQVQGYYFAKSMTMDEFESRWLNEQETGFTKLS